MKNLAPNIIRQRLLIEGFYTIGIDENIIENYFKKITDFSTGGIGKKENQGYDAFVPLIDSGISVYIWANSKFFSIIIYTCKNFDERKAIAATKEFFQSDKLDFSSF